MGRGIDRLVLLSLLAGAIYVFFIGAMGSIPLSAAAAFIALALLRKLTGRIPTDRLTVKRRALANAKREAEELALTDTERARERIENAVRSAYPGEADNAVIEPVLRHPSGGRLTAADVCDIWKTHTGSEHLVIVSLCACDESAVRLAARLASPEVRLMDISQLIQILAAQPEDCVSHAPLKPEKRAGYFARAARAACRARAGKCVTAGGVMALLFMITGSLYYLLGALIMTFIVCASLRQKRRQEKLFG